MIGKKFVRKPLWPAIKRQNRATRESALLEKFNQLRRGELTKLLKAKIRAEGIGADARRLVKKLKESKQGKLSDDQNWALRQELISYLVKKSMNEMEY